MNRAAFRHPFSRLGPEKPGDPSPFVPEIPSDPCYPIRQAIAKPAKPIKQQPCQFPK